MTGSGEGSTGCVVHVESELCCGQTWIVLYAEGCGVSSAC